MENTLNTGFSFDLPKGNSSIIKVIGVGGGGNNALKHMYEKGIHGVDFIICNTDAQTLDNNPISTKVQLGAAITEGLGAGADPEVVEKSALESIDEIKAVLGHNTKMVFITAGMGGGTGTGAAPVIAQISRDLGALTVGVVTRPFGFEGSKRGYFASEGIELLKASVDTLLIISNNNLLEIVDKKTPLKEALQEADNVLRQGVQGVTDLITNPGMINLDFADVKTVMANKGDALMGIGTASGEDRVIEATRKAIYSPLLETTIEGAENVLLNVTGGMDMSLTEAQDASELVIQAAGNDVNILLGTSIDESLKDEIRVTVVATGVSEDDLQQTATRQTQTAAPVAEQPRRRVLGSSNLDLSNNNFATRQKTAAPESSAPESAFGNWDIRKENTVRQTPSEPTSTTGVSSFGGTTTSSNDEDLDIPPFLKR